MNPEAMNSDEKIPAWKLIPLTPDYIPDEHGQYVTALEDAINNNKIRNIALSGNYGVGKSSILQEFIKNQKGNVIELSLSTLAPIEISKIDDSVPAQATTPTNRIQQEIVKQLLYRNKPSKMPGSRFHRIESFRKTSAIITALLLGLVVTVVSFLAGWTAKINKEFPIPIINERWAHFFIWVTLTAIIYKFYRQLYGNIQIKELSAGAATVTLNENSVSFFDQYLDEIVYFFEVSECNIVIFEDIDRFDEPQIFETLRALNSVLNSSSQIKQKIIFIYAIKDSIFDSLNFGFSGNNIDQEYTSDQVKTEMSRANRTKFFDLIIPVVPFITHQNARSVAAQVLEETGHKINSELLDLVAHHIPDMRLIKNICNEFIIFHDRIFSGEGGNLGLNETELFAMILYKNTHLNEFEMIRHGRSNLDKIYTVSRKLVSENIRKIENNQSILQSKQESDKLIEQRSIKLGQRFITCAEYATKWANHSQENSTYKFNGITISQDKLKKSELWLDFATAEGDPSIERYDNYNRNLSFKRSQLVEFLEDSLDSEDWNVADKKYLLNEIEKCKENINFLRSSDMRDLIKKNEFLVSYKSEDCSFEQIVKKILNSDLAYHLISAGYINRNFTLYTSTYHGNRVSAAAMNFIIHHADRNRMDTHFRLTQDDVKAVIREKGINALSEPGFYNIDILDHLLATNDTASNIMIQSLSSMENTQLQFIQAYFVTGQQRQEFVKRLMKFSSNALIYIIDEVELDDNSRLNFVDIALSNIFQKGTQINESVSTYLMNHYTKLEILKLGNIKPDQAEIIAELFTETNSTVSDLSQINSELQLKFISLNLYQINKKNLTIAINQSENHSLDAIKSTNKNVYNHTLNNLNEYLNTLDIKSHTINSNLHFISIVNDVNQVNRNYLHEIIERSSIECFVEDLTNVPVESWGSLACYLKFPATANNISLYINAYGLIDSNLTKILNSTKKITEYNSLSEDSKTAVALAIVNSDSPDLSAKQRIQLVRSLELEHYLDLYQIKDSSFSLYPKMLSGNLIEDSADSFMHLAKASWPIRKLFIQESQEFINYMDYHLIQQDLVNLLKDSEINKSIKIKIIDSVPEFAEEFTLKDFNAISEFSIINNLPLSSEATLAMIKIGVANEKIIKIVAHQIDAISSIELFKILNMMGKDYNKLTEIGREKPKIFDTPEHRLLLDRLKQEGIISSYKERQTKLLINKKYK